MANAQQIDRTQIGDASMALLRELEATPQVVGYDHRIVELDTARLIEWQPGWGYIANAAGRALIGADPNRPAA